MVIGTKDFRIVMGVTDVLLSGVPGLSTYAYLSYWLSLASAFGADRLTMVDHTVNRIGMEYGFTQFPKLGPIHVKRVDRYDQVALDGYIPVVVTRKEATALEVFVHPEKAIYFFGSDDPLLQFDPPEKALKVTIPTVGDVPLWADQAAAIVFADRDRKGL